MSGDVYGCEKCGESIYTSCDCGIPSFNDAVELDSLKSTNAKLVEFVVGMSEVRLYNSANIFKGPMIRDKSKVHDLVMKARQLLAEIEGSGK